MYIHVFSCNGIPTQIMSKVFYLLLHLFAPKHKEKSLIPAVLIHLHLAIKFVCSLNVFNALKL